MHLSMSFVSFINWDTSVNPRHERAMSLTKIIFYFETFSPAKAKGRLKGSLPVSIVLLLLFLTERNVTFG